MHTEVNTAFSKQSAYFDAYDYSNEILVYMRTQVRNHVLKFLKKDDYILELNAGTGLDACFFAEYGCNVHATDISDGMLGRFQEKLDNYPHLQSKIQIQKCSYTELNQVKTASFNYVFSNFGGLNCISNLQKVTQHLPEKLQKGAYITWVVMPPVCLWEMKDIFKGQFSSALRRFKKNGTKAHLEGEYFDVFYFTPSQVQKSFGKSFKLVSLEGMGGIMPPPSKEDFPKKYPKLYQKLIKWDEKLRYKFPFNAWADHFIITLQYMG
ncbi:MAG: class I SAM-dependent methyltransferase [Raineya sp.]|jgi:ubiquinone/menaquinone biosynthesis C-methylase UbiE|nr:class I SAM-dependent methyltransferase [Raineya sp.]